jgi:hypothetical protein
MTDRSDYQAARRSDVISVVIPAKISNASIEKAVKEETKRCQERSD